MAKHKILFLPHYSEPLKVFLPLIQCARRRGHEVAVICYERTPADRLRTAGILAENNEKVRFIDNLDHTPPIRAGLPELGVTYRKLKAYKAMKRLLDEVKPDILVLGNEHMEWLAYLIKIGKRRGIPSLCFQWTIASSSERNAREMEERFAREDILAEHPKRGIVYRVERLARDVFGWFNTLFCKIRGLELAFDSPYYGCGNATRMAVIGQGSLEAFSSYGGKASRMVITGYPIYEALHYKAKKRVAGKPNLELRRRLGLPLDKTLFLWGSNDQQTYYAKDYTDKQMQGYWSEIRDTILKANSHWHLVIKLHPKQKREDWLPVVEGQPRVTLAPDCDVWELIAESDYFLTRFSSTGVSAIMLEKKVISCNYPKVAGGTFYEDVGGTFHANTLAELEEIAAGLATDPIMGEEAITRGRRFRGHFIDIQDRPAEERVIDFVEQMLASAQ